MHTSIDSCAPSGRAPRTAAEIVLRHARRLHRAAKSGRISTALPALRRIDAARVLPGVSLSALYKNRKSLQRKHFLRLLAIEAGFPDWERFRPQLEHMSCDAFDHYKLAAEWTSSLNCWFSNEAQAIAFARDSGGRVVRFGTQAAVVSAPAPSGPEQIDELA